MKIMKTPPKNNNSSNFFQHLKKRILCINFIHDIHHSITNYNKTSSNSVPEFVYELSGSGFELSCSHNLWYLFLLQVKEYHEDWPCKTTKFGAFRKKNILSTAEAHDYYFREKGKRLAGPHHFGFDPPHENIHMQEICTSRFYGIFLNAEHIFTIWEM